MTACAMMAAGTMAQDLQPQAAAERETLAPQAAIPPPVARMSVEGETRPIAELPPEVVAPVDELTLFADFPKAKEACPLFLVNRTKHPARVDSLYGKPFTPSLLSRTKAGKWVEAHPAGPRMVSGCGDGLGRIELGPGEFMRLGGFVRVDGEKAEVRYLLDGLNVVSNVGLGLGVPRHLYLAEVNPEPENKPGRNGINEIWIAGTIDELTVPPPEKSWAVPREISKKEAKGMAADVIAWLDLRSQWQMDGAVRVQGRAMTMALQRPINTLDAATRAAARARLEEILTRQMRGESPPGVLVAEGLRLLTGNPPSPAGGEKQVAGKGEAKFGDPAARPAMVWRAMISVLETRQDPAALSPGEWREFFETAVARVPEAKDAELAAISGCLFLNGAVEHMGREFLVAQVNSPNASMRYAGMARLRGQGAWTDLAKAGLKGTPEHRMEVLDHLFRELPTEGRGRGLVRTPGRITDPVEKKFWDLCIRENPWETCRALIRADRSRLPVDVVTYPAYQAAFDSMLATAETGRFPFQRQGNGPGPAVVEYFIDAMGEDGSEASLARLQRTAALVGKGPQNEPEGNAVARKEIVKQAEGAMRTAARLATKQR